MFEITPQKVEKDQICTLQFPNQPIEHSEEKLSYLKKSFLKARKIGSSYKRKIKIVFYDTTGLKVVEASIGNSTAESVILNNGANIPFNRVVDVKYA